MSGDTRLYIEVPVVGEEQISLYNESKEIYELFEDEILRLKEIMQLGVLHYFSEKLFKYSRYDHVLTMLLFINRLERLEETEKLINKLEEFLKMYDKGEHKEHELEKIEKLIDRLKKFYESEEIRKKSTRRRLSTTAKLNGVEFSSVSELLKSWSLLYPIGHFQITFASSHAFLKWLKSEKTRENEFLELIKERIEESKLFKQESSEVKDRLKIQLEQVIKEERVMQVHKIFTFLKILKIAEEKLQDDSPLIPKLRELVKLMIFRENYPDYGEPERIKDPEHNEKIKDIVNYFIVLRELSFTILDGYVAQLPIQLTYPAILNALPLFIHNTYYKEAIENVEKFYTKILYQSAEGAYYHLRAINTINERIFSGYTSVSDFVDAILSNQLDKRIVEAIRRESDQIVKEKHQGVLNKTISTSIEFTLDSLPTPVSTEMEYLDDTMPGVIVYNIPSKEHQVFVYPSLIQEEDPIKKIYYLLRVSKILYLPLAEFKKDHEKDFREYPFPKILKMPFEKKVMFESSKLACYILRELFDNKVLTNRKELRPPSISAPSRSLQNSFFSIPVPSIIPSENLKEYLELFEPLSEIRPEKGKLAEEHYLLTMLQDYINRKKLDWYLIALDTKIKEKEIKTDLDILIVGFSPKLIMLSLNEVKSGKQTQSSDQREKYEEIIRNLQIKFESYGYKIKTTAPDNRREIKTWILEIPIELLH